MMDLDRAMQRIAGYLIRHYSVFRHAFLLAADWAITFTSFIAAIYLYTRAKPVPYEWGIIYAMIFIAFGAKLCAFLVFRIYNISFQHVSALYTLKTSAVICSGALATYLILKGLYPSYWFPAVAMLQLAGDIVLSVAFRFSPLVYYEICAMMAKTDKSCLVYGCGDTGKSLIPVLGRSKVKVAGFIDDDHRLSGKIVNGVKVMGTLADLDAILGRMRVDVIVIAIPSLDGAKIKGVRQLCGRFNIELKTVPSLYQVYNKPADLIAASVRSIDYEDLIRRPVRKESLSGLAESLRTKKAIVTGAGSIGAELVNQLVQYGVGEVIAIDNNELNLFNIMYGSLTEERARVRTILCDLKNRKAVAKIFSRYRPDIVFHTAAYKHVPVVEENVCEGALNNLLCLKNVYESAEETGVGKFIFISSDKAVRPTNIMGATKRLGELYVQAKQEKGKMRGSSVRFGNVLGSSGSLVPNIVYQIQHGLPVTVTHPEATRFFMLVSEAVMLILKASVISKGSEIFVLDMGKPIRIVDLVKEIIEFYGKTAGVDVPIKYIGLRPGEKLFEELVFDGIESSTYSDGLYIATPHPRDGRQLLEAYEKILASAADGDEAALMRRIKETVELSTNDLLAKEKAR